jgi:hypothetical protein
MEVIGMEFSLNRINPNQTQVFFSDGRFETLTNDELELLLAQYSYLTEGESDLNSSISN